MGDYMDFKIGDLVTRNSYNNDIVFKIADIVDDNYILNGINMRLCADSKIEDLKLFEKKEDEKVEDDDSFFNVMKNFFNLDRSEYFYLPGRILHIDGDYEYLERCLKFYKASNVLAYGIHLKEDEMPVMIKKYLEEINPDIVIITGHDAYYRRLGPKEDMRSYKNSVNFQKAVIEARKYEKAHDKLIIIAGACQSHYEALIKVGANFASSPRRINIHALDPAIIALTVSLTDKNKEIDLFGILEKTKYGKAGVGGLITKGTMYIGYPR
jgi:spore coat assembly protein